MPKMKTKSGAKKRFRVTSSGKVKFKPANRRHLLMNKSKSQKKKTKGTQIMCDSNAVSVLDNWLPYQTGKKQNLKAKRAPRKVEPRDAATTQKEGA